jgi:hypothetical protein
MIVNYFILRYNMALYPILCYFSLLPHGFQHLTHIERLADIARDQLFMSTFLGEQLERTELRRPCEILTPLLCGHRRRVNRVNHADTAVRNPVYLLAVVFRGEHDFVGNEALDTPCPASSFPYHLVFIETPLDCRGQKGVSLAPGLRAYPNKCGKLFIGENVARLALFEPVNQYRTVDVQSRHTLKPCLFHRSPPCEWLLHLFEIPRDCLICFF